MLNRSEQKQSLHKTGFNLTLSQVIGKNDRTNRERMLVPVHYRFLIIRSWFIQIISRWCQFSSWISSLDTKCSSNECRGETNLYRLQYFGRSLVQSFTFRPPAPPPLLAPSLTLDSHRPSHDGRSYLRKQLRTATGYVELCSSAQLT